MSTLDLLRSRRNALVTIGARHGARNIRVFGSVARGDDTETSDIDLLVDMEQGRSLLDLVGFQQEVSEALGRNTDVLTANAISPYLRDRILSEAIRL